MDLLVHVGLLFLYHPSNASSSWQLHFLPEAAAKASLQLFQHSQTWLPGTLSKTAVPANQFPLLRDLGPSTRGPLLQAYVFEQFQHLLFVFSSSDISCFLQLYLKIRKFCLFSSLILINTFSY